MEELCFRLGVQERNLSLTVRSILRECNLEEKKKRQSAQGRLGLNAKGQIKVKFGYFCPQELTLSSEAELNWNHHERAERGPPLTRLCTLTSMLATSGLDIAASR
jgi:hypothetical protein